MAPHLIDHVALLLGGALIAVVVGVALFFVGRTSKDPGALQARVTARELMLQRQGWRRQLDAIRKAVSIMKGHPETRPNSALYLEEFIEPLLTDRAPAGEEPTWPWWRRLFKDRRG